MSEVLLRYIEKQVDSDKRWLANTIRPTNAWESLARELLENGAEQRDWLVARVRALERVTDAVAKLINVEPVLENNASGIRRCAVCGANDIRARLDDLPHLPDCEWLLAKAALAALDKGEE